MRTTPIEMGIRMAVVAGWMDRKAFIALQHAVMAKQSRDLGREFGA
ncbi:MAG: hypothetical protein ABGX08_02690 [Citromicrobium sp.]